MMRPKRPKVIKAKLEKELERYSKRIQKLASKAYLIRQMLEDLAVTEQSLTPEVVTNAVLNTGVEGNSGQRSADPGTGDAELLNNIVAAAVLPEQSEKLPSIE